MLASEHICGYQFSRFWKNKLIKILHCIYFHFAHISAKIKTFTVLRLDKYNVIFPLFQWDLVCDKEWIISTITTIQMGGLLIGAFMSGQMGDSYGRKPTYYASLIILVVFNTAAAFSVNWQMFAVLRFFIGMGCGWYLTIDVTYVAELTPAKYRSLILSLPTWPLGTITFGLMTWLIHDWKYVQIACAVFCLPWFIGIW